MPAEIFPTLRPLPIDQEYLVSILRDLLAIPSPTGYTDEVVRRVVGELGSMGIEYQVTRRGAIRATLKGEHAAPQRALVTHVDTLGAMVRELKPTGRLAVTPVGSWSSRFAEGARVTIFTDTGSFRGTMLPLKASGHIFDHEVDAQPVNWDQVEVRIDEPVAAAADLRALGIDVGDFVAVDPQPEFMPSGYIVSRHLDDKAGVAAVLAAARAITGHAGTLPISCHLLFTVSEEVGSGASTTLHQDVAEMVAVDNSTIGPSQASSEFGVTVAMADKTGPFDYHLTRRLLGLAGQFRLEHARDVFRHYRCDAASAVESGNDIRTALVCFACDASHGYERTHIRSLMELAQLLVLYMRTPPIVWRDRRDLGPIDGLPEQPQNEHPPVPTHQPGGGA